MTNTDYETIAKNFREFFNVVDALNKAVIITSVSHWKSEVTDGEICHCKFMVDGMECEINSHINILTRPMSFIAFGGKLETNFHHIEIFNDEDTDSTIMYFKDVSGHNAGELQLK